MTKLLDSKFAVVTGGGSGIGRAVCQRFAQNGARVIVVDIDGRKAKETCATLQKERPDAHAAFTCDVSKRAQVEKLKEYSRERWIRAPNVTKALTELALADEVSQSIINISSIVGKSAELARKRIRVNTVLPGFVNTPLTADLPREERQKLCDAIPMGRLATPAEIADAVLFFASDMSQYVTGATLEVTGGFDM
ncbi:unnamed protein product [Gongylonema pulchrum]|uniref:SDR family oxidoreductase n=1 Tax=Gongylonema pulchrum TaxID=637853 RepID=A0A183E7X1_9BILA|nr:unnamed protein product [Gongylonema pulchrum]